MMASNTEFIVVGCGVSGLTSAIKLLEKYAVKIIAHGLPPDTTSDVAAAFWEPYEAYPKHRVLDWSKVSLAKYHALAGIAGSGVFIEKIMYLFNSPTPPLWWWEETGVSYREAAPLELPHGYAFGFVAEIPKIETPIHMPYLMRTFKEAGGVIEQLQIPLANISELYASNRIIVNCTGLGAHTFCPDPEVFPIRGQVMRVRAPGVGRLIRDYSEGEALTYIVPRTDDCILGGTHQDNDWNLLAEPQTAKDIFENCLKIVPELSKAVIIEDRVGLRPGRREVRLELEQISQSCAVVHNYGHAGAGFTLSWGCALEVAEMVERFLTLSTALPI